jgi:hypothetical protein
MPDLTKRVINNREWYEDARLKEWRAVDNPHERIPFDHDGSLYDNPTCPKCLKEATGTFAVLTSELDMRREGEVFYESGGVTYHDNMRPVSSGHVGGVPQAVLICENEHQWNAGLILPRGV